MQLPELLMPGGSLAKAYTAFRYGADALYCGLPMFSLRTRENDFTKADLIEIVDYAHKNGKKVYVTMNAFPQQSMMKLIADHLVWLEELKPDGIILADIGVLSYANQYAPSIEKHLSVQTSTLNEPAMRMWQDLGICRVICAREMSIREVARIHQAFPEMELEYFIHGSVCMAYSGRCLLSQFTGGRDANCGACNHTCRWNYQIVDQDKNVFDAADHWVQAETCKSDSNELRSSEVIKGEGETVETKNFSSSDFMGQPRSIKSFESNVLLEEQKRRGQFFSVEEDFHGTHIMSSRDMCMLEYLPQIMAAGVCSLKVEGRHKTAYYAATVARTYREALDNIAAGKEFDPTLWDEIHATANRGFFPGFANGRPQTGDIQYEANRSTGHKEVCGLVRKWENGRAEIVVKNRIDLGNTIETVCPLRQDDISFTVQKMWFGDQSVTALHGGDNNRIATIKCPEIPPAVFLRQKNL